MTLIEARRIVRTMLFGATGRADLDQITLDTILDATNKALWLRAVKAAQSMFTAFWDVTVTANSRGQYELWQLDGNPPAVMLGARNLTDLRDELTKDFNDALVKRHGGPRRAHFVPYE